MILPELLTLSETHDIPFTPRIITVSEFGYDDEDRPNISLTIANPEDKMGVIGNGLLHSIFRQNLPEGYIRRYIFQKLTRHNRRIKVDDICKCKRNCLWRTI